MELKRFIAAVQWKASDPDSDTNVVEGFASVFGFEDEQQDIVHRGAFKKTVRERVPKGLVKLLDSHVPDGFHTLGTVIEAREVRGEPSGEGALWFKANLSSAPSVQDTKVKMMEGHLDRVSIGYLPTEDGERLEQKDDGRWIRHLTEVKLYEISIVPVPANELATVTSVKSDASKSLRARQAELERALGIRRGGLSGPPTRPRDRSVAALDRELQLLELDIAMDMMEGSP